MSQIHENIEAIRNRITNACAACDRDPEEISLLLATKTQPTERIIEAIQYGERLIGENRVQELIAKSEELKDQAVEKHMIGHLQSNKAGKALDHVICVQSIDRLSIAEKLDRLCDQRERTLDIFLQFNTSGEASKFGMEPDQAIAFTRNIAKLQNLRIRGLMTVGFLAPHPVASRDSLSALRLLRDKINLESIENVNLEHLSMGMSTDLEIAVEEGSTMLRIGTDIFGRRDLPPGTYWPEKQWAHLGSKHKD